MVQVDAIGDGQSGWPVIGTDVGNTAAIWVQPQIAGTFEWLAAVTTVEGCGASTRMARQFKVVK